MQADTSSFNGVYPGTLQAVEAYWHQKTGNTSPCPKQAHSLKIDEAFEQLGKFCIDQQSEVAAASLWADDLLALDSLASYEKKPIRRFKRICDLVHLRQQILTQLSAAPINEESLSSALETLTDILVKPGLIYKSRFQKSFQLLVPHLHDLVSPLVNLSLAPSLSAGLKKQVQHVLDSVQAWGVPEEMRHQPAYYEITLLREIEHWKESQPGPTNLRQLTRSYCEKVLQEAPLGVSCHFYRRSSSVASSADEEVFVRSSLSYGGNINHSLLIYRAKTGEWELRFVPKNYGLSMSAISGKFTKQEKLYAKINGKFCAITTERQWLSLTYDSEFAIRATTLQSLENLFQSSSGISFPLLPAKDKVPANDHVLLHTPHYMDDLKENHGSTIGYLTRFFEESYTEINKKNDFLAKAHPSLWSIEKEYSAMIEELKMAYFQVVLKSSQLNCCPYLLCRASVTSLFALVFCDPTGTIHQHTLKINHDKRIVEWKGKQANVEKLQNLLETIYPGSKFEPCAYPFDDKLPLATFASEITQKILRKHYPEILLARW